MNAAADSVGLKVIMRGAYQNAVAHGFWEGPEQDNIPTKIALIHEEASEALKAFCLGYMYLTYVGEKPEGFGIELADTLIRICDLAERLGIDLPELVLIKMAYNRTRSMMHGGRKV
jgi:hypothetical protein